MVLATVRRMCLLKLHETVLRRPSMPPVAQISGTLPPFRVRTYVAALHAATCATIRVSRPVKITTFPLSPRGAEVAAADVASNTGAFISLLLSSAFPPSVFSEEFSRSVERIGMNPAVSACRLRPQTFLPPGGS